MSQVSFEPEAQFLLFDRVHKVLSFKRIQVEEQPFSAKLELIDAEGIRTEKSLDYLLDQYAKRNVRPVHADLLPPAQKARSTKKVYPLAQDIADDDLARGQKRKKLLLAVHQAGGLGWGSVDFWEEDYVRVAKECGFDQDPPARQTVKRWQRKVACADGVPMEVVLADDRSNHGGRGQLRIADSALGLLQQCVEDHYFGTPGASFSYCHRQVVLEFTTHNKLVQEKEQLKIPGYKQTVNFICSLPAFEVVAAKFGHSFACEHFTAVKYRNLKKLRPLERVEIDHTPLDIFALSDEGVFLGRVRLTLVIDVRCKAIIGYSIGFGAPSAAAVLEALRHACTPKTYLRERYPDIRNVWPMHGMIGLLAMDNGQEFHSKAKFKASIIEFSMASEFAWMPRKKGRYKGLIEAIQKYLNRQAMDNQPGATGSHPHVRKPSEVPPEQYTVFKLTDLHRLLHTYICDVHNVSGHGKSKIVPLKTWRELTSLMPVRLPGHYDRLELACSTGVLRRIQPYGLDLADLRSFNCNALQEIRRLYEHQGTVQVQVRYREALLDKAWVKHPGTEEWLVVPNHDPETCNKSAYQVRLMRRMQREAEKEGEGNLQVAEAFRRMREIGVRLLTAKTIAQRKRGLQLLGLLPGTSAEYLDARTRPAAQRPSVEPPERTRASRKPPVPRPTPTPPPGRLLTEHGSTERPPAPPPTAPTSVPKPLQLIGGTRRPLF